VMIDLNWFPKDETSTFYKVHTFCGLVAMILIDEVEKLDLA
jgi:hypothetical protein